MGTAIYRSRHNGRKTLQKVRKPASQREKGVKATAVSRCWVGRADREESKGWVCGAGTDHVGIREQATRADKKDERNRQERKCKAQIIMFYR